MKLMHGMTPIVKNSAKFLCGPIFMFGIYITVNGHVTPGGGFAGGVIMCGAFVLLILAFGGKLLNLKAWESESSLLESMALFTFLLLGTIGLLLGLKIFYYDYLPKGNPGELISAGLIPLYNIFIGIEVAAALFTIFLALVIYREEILK
jgi:multisubunit Na+/H+ antiporter MnhB subunit